MNIATWIGMFLFVIPLSIMVLGGLYYEVTGASCSGASISGGLCNLMFAIGLGFGMTGIWIIGLISLIVGVTISAVSPSKSVTTYASNQTGGRRR